MKAKVGGRSRNATAHAKSKSWKLQFGDQEQVENKENLGMFSDVFEYKQHPNSKTLDYQIIP